MVCTRSLINVRTFLATPTYNYLISNHSTHQKTTIALLLSAQHEAACTLKVYRAFFVTLSAFWPHWSIASLVLRAWGRGYRCWRSQSRCLVDVCCNVYCAWWTYYHYVDAVSLHTYMYIHTHIHQYSDFLVVLISVGLAPIICTSLQSIQ